jgi:hypothetical protein
MSNRPQTLAVTPCREHSHLSLDVKTLLKIRSTHVVGTKLASICGAIIRASAAKFAPLIVFPMFSRDMILRLRVEKVLRVFQITRTSLA